MPPLGYWSRHVQDGHRAVLLGRLKELVRVATRDGLDGPLPLESAEHFERPATICCDLVWIDGFGLPFVMMVPL